MATSAARLIACPVQRPRPAPPQPSHDLEFMRVGRSTARRFEMEVRRTPTGVEVECSCGPAPEGLEVEVRAGDERRAQPVPADGRLVLGGLPTDCRHVNVVVRGGGLPAIAFLKLPID